MDLKQNLDLVALDMIMSKKKSPLLEAFILNEWFTYLKLYVMTAIPISLKCGKILAFLCQKTRFQSMCHVIDRIICAPVLLNSLNLL